MKADYTKCTTDQEIFDAVWDVISKQGPSATTVARHGIPKAKCMYRDPEGRECAIGIFIPDDIYNPAMECSQVTTLLTTIDPLARLPDGEFRDWVDTHRSLLADLQRAHDNSILADGRRDADYTFRFHKRMHRIAEEFGLDLAMNEDEQQEEQERVRTGILIGVAAGALIWGLIALISWVAGLL